MTGLASGIFVAETVSMRSRPLVSFLFIVIAVGLGFLIAWLGTTPIFDAPAKVFDRVKSGTVNQNEP
jgi:hypothetical protein